MGSKIAFNARILDTNQIRGWSRYTLELIKELSKKDIDLVLLSDREINRNLLPKDENIKVVYQQGFNYFDWEQRVLPKMAIQEGADILHCPTNFGLPYFCSVKKVLTLHDAIEKAFYDEQKGIIKKSRFLERKMRLYHYLSQYAADVIITVSEHAKQDLIKYYGIKEKKIKVIYEAADDHFHIQSVKPFVELKEKYALQTSDYFFYVGGLEERKNIPFLLKAYALSSQKFKLLIGGSGDREPLLKICRSLGIEKQVQFLGYLEDDDLPSFYHYSRAFIYPSLYEGFGLQVAEAMKMGKPVLVSGNTSLGEIVNNKESVFSPFAPKELAEKINLLSQDDECLKFSKKSQERSSDFSWKKCAEQTLAVYNEVLNGSFGT